MNWSFIKTLAWRAYGFGTMVGMVGLSTWSLFYGAPAIPYFGPK